MPWSATRRTPFFAAALLCAAWLAGCTEPPPAHLSTQTFEAAVPGMWNPPQSTRNIAAMQYVTVVDPPAVSPLGSCSSSNPFACSCTHPECTPGYPGTVALRDYILNRWPWAASGGTYCCRQNSAQTSVPKLSVHAIGRAVDIMIPMDGGDADNGLGDQIANWLVENAEFIGIQRVVWDRAYWNGERGFGALTGSSPHIDHIHLEVSIAGAHQQTGFFTSGAVNNACTAQCNGTRLINADCTQVDCAANGAECLTGPPRCGQPPPPEPDLAAAVGNPSLPSITTFGTPKRVTLDTPTRLVDTRTAQGSAELVRGDGTTSGPMTATGSNDLTPTVTPGTTALWLNLAAIAGEVGFVSVGPGGQPEPGTSNLNYFEGEVRANAVPALIGSNGAISFFTLSDIDAIVDRFGSFTPTGDGLTTINPTRVYDSRSSGGTLPAMTEREIDVQAPAGATGVVTTVAVISKDAPGHLVAYPCGTSRPGVSNINYPPTAVVANSVISRLGANGRMCVWTLADIELIVDVTGYLSADGALSYQPLQPARLLDTRQDNTPYQGRLGFDQVIELPIQSLAGMPANVWAVTANLAVVGTDENGFLTAYPCGISPPQTSSLNYTPGRVVSAVVTSPLGADGKLCIRAKNRAHVIVDVQGVWVHDESLIPPPPTDPGDGGDGGDEGGPIDPPDPMDPDPTEDTGPTDTTTGDDTTTADAIATDTTADATTTTAPMPDTDPSADTGLTDTNDGSLGSNTAEGGCGCRVRPGSDRDGRGAGWPFALLLLVGLGWLRRRRR